MMDQEEEEEREEENEPKLIYRGPISEAPQHVKEVVATLGKVFGGSKKIRESNKGEEGKEKRGRPVRRHTSEGREEKRGRPVRRKMIWSNRLENPEICPNCKIEMEEKMENYLVVARKKKGKHYESFIMLEESLFCPNCDVAVLYRDKFAEMTRHYMDPPFEFAALGTVDLNAMRPAAPPGTKDNPIAVVRFKNVSKSFFRNIIRKAETSVKDLTP